MELNTPHGVLEIFRITPQDVPAVLALCCGNPLYYRHCPPDPSTESILADMAALPPGKTAQDKYYLGIRKDGRLAVVWDLILGFPDDRTAFWGFFMVDAALQGQGFGSALVSALCDLLAPHFDHIRLGFVSTNPQSRHFWLKNGFVPTGAVSKQETYEIIYAQRELKKRSTTMTTEERIRRGNIVLTEWTGERDAGCFLGSGRFGAVFASTGMNLSPKQQAVPGRNSSHFRHIGHWGRFRLVSPYTQQETSADYLLPLFRLYWEREQLDLTGYRQCHDLYDGVLHTRFTPQGGGSVAVTGWFDAVNKDLAGFLIETDKTGADDRLCLSVLTPFNPWPFLCREEFEQTVTVGQTEGGYKLTVTCEAAVNKPETVLYITTDMAVETHETGLYLCPKAGSNRLLIAVGEPDTVTAEQSLQRTGEQNHRTWEDLGWLELPEEQHRVWVRSMAYMLASYDADCGYIQPVNGMGINGFPYNFVPDIANLAPSLSMLGRGDIVRRWVEKFAGEIDDLRRYARALWPTAEGIFPPWELNFGPYEGYHAPNAPMIFFYEAHNTGYLAKLAMEAAEHSGDEAWNKTYAYPLIDECAKFFRRFCHKEADGLWHLTWYPCMGRDEAGGVNKDDYLCTLITAKYSFQAAIRCGFDPDGDYARILAEGLAFASLRSARGTLHTCRGADDFGKQKHPVQLEGIANFPTAAAASEEELAAYRLRHDITQDARQPRFWGWTLAQLLMAGTNLKKPKEWQHDWDLLRPSDNTDEHWIQFYESCGVHQHAFYTATHGMVLQSLIQNCVNDFWGRLEIGSCLPADACVRFGNIRTRLGVTVSGRIDSGRAAGSITAFRDTVFVFRGEELHLKQGETASFDFCI